MTNALEIYKPPFRTDGVFVWSSNDVMALMCADGIADQELLLTKLCDILNGTAKPAKISEYNYYATEIYCNEKLLLIVRGWGHLTGKGALNLDEETAVQIQDEFGKWVISKLSGK